MGDDDYMVSKNKRKRYRKTIANFCLMDDTFMAKFFENNIEDTEYLLHLILEDDKIRVDKVIGQYSIANLQGHPAVLNACKYMESMGCEVTYLPVNSVGAVSPHDLEKAIQPHFGRDVHRYRQQSDRWFLPVGHTGATPLPRHSLDRVPTYSSDSPDADQSAGKDDRIRKC